MKPEPDARIAPYIKALRVNSVVSRSHEVLREAYAAHGAAVIDALMSQYWENLREHSNRVVAPQSKKPECGADYSRVPSEGEAA